MPGLRARFTRSAERRPAAEPISSSAFMRVNCRKFPARRLSWKINPARSATSRPSTSRDSSRTVTRSSLRRRVRTSGASPSLFKKLAFDPINDFEHVAPLLKNTWILAVAGDSPHKTAAELTAYLKEQGEKASTAPLANTGLVSTELYKANFGLKTVEVKYKETLGALNDLWAGNLAFIHIDPTGGGAHFKSGKLRPLATASAERMQSIKDIPSAREVGITNSDVIGWWSVEMPKGTPKPVLEKLEGWFAQITAADDTRAFLANVNCDPFPGSSAMLRELLIKETNNWKDYVKLAKIEQI